MTIFKAIILGIIQGVAEFLPISSSAHLIVFPYLFGWEESSLAFDVALHFGTMMAVLVIFFKDWWNLFIGAIKDIKNKKKTTNGKMFWYLVVATIPAAIVGFLLDDVIENVIRNNIWLIASALAIMGMLIYLGDKWATHHYKKEKKFEDITLKIFNVKDYSKVLENAISNGIKIYNDAYISCANKAFGYDRKHDNHLALLNKMFNEDKIQEKIVKCKTMEEAFNIIKSYPLIGNFMAYQLVTDINYSEIVNWREDEFTVAGPGSLRGIKKCFIDKGKMSSEDIIRYMYDHQDEEFKRLNLNFKRIGNRPLQLIDCQNIFCELDKYCRQALPDLKSNRTKIKKHYVPKKEIIEYIYPPKWKLNN